MYIAIFCFWLSWSAFASWLPTETFFELATLTCTQSMQNWFDIRGLTKKLCLSRYVLMLFSAFSNTFSVTFKHGERWSQDFKQTCNLSGTLRRRSFFPPLAKPSLCQDHFLIFLPLFISLLWQCHHHHLPFHHALTRRLRRKILHPRSSINCKVCPCVRVCVSVCTYIWMTGEIVAAAGYKGWSPCYSFCLFRRPLSLLRARLCPSLSP